MNRLNDEQIGQILVDLAYLEEEIIMVMLKRARDRSVPLSTVLITEELITKDLLGQALAEYYKVPYADLNSVIPTKEQVQILPERLAKQFNLVIFKKENGKITFATDDPSNPQLLSSLEHFATDSPDFQDVDQVEIAYSLTEDIEVLFSNYEMPLQDKLQKLFSQKEISVKSLIDEILSSAYESKATDIHMEPKSYAVIIRFRIDGILQEVADINPDIYEKVVNRVKVLTRLRIDEHFTIQDGSFSHEWDKKHYDLRISFVPTLYGEKLAIRILAQYVGGLSMDQVGLGDADQKIFESSTRKPFGMIIVSGPTGSGKTTTLYAALTKVITPGLNIMSIEDPVEYRIKGATQVQVNKETGINFASGLKALVRQDPDIILVGEIRDKESAEIAVNAALTGHLLLSTFHANDASTVVPRLIDMGIEPFLLASTIELVVAQRLVRKLCDSCKVSKSYTPTQLEKEYNSEVREHLGDKKVTLYEAKGCSMCNYKGYKGRTAIFEMIPTSKEFRQLILDDPSADAIRNLSHKKGRLTLYQDGLEKVKAGLTTVSEVVRVAQLI